MSLPPGFLDELRTRISLAQVVGAKVTWDMRKSQQGKGDMWAPCPFHQEKTASFHVDDRKGFYYCFGCHEKGDAIGFVMATENVGFMEAVRILAAEAGMTMPERDARAQVKADRNAELAEVMEQAVRAYARHLRGGAGRAARSYLAGRGLDEDAQRRWELGYAPGGWQTLWDELTGKGVPEASILETGLAKPSRKGGRPYDTFRDRIMFPIRDARGRAVAFGGRAMDPGESAKYLNSPETPLFDKGRTLYNLGPARAAAKDGPLLVAEGYMDVIALSEAGFAATVAPLGTAITEAQLQLLWRVSPEPVVALDGDAAGQRAGMRLIDLALPMIGAGRSLRFATLPPGQDPDDLLKAAGAGAMRALVDGAEPIVALLWRRETEGQDFDSPERRAALDAALARATGRIADPGLRRHYEQALRDLKWEFFRPRKRDAKTSRRPSGARPMTRASGLAGRALSEERMRQTVVLAVLIQYPGLAPRFEDALSRVSWEVPEFSRIAAHLTRSAATDPDALRGEIGAKVAPDALESLQAPRHLRVVPALHCDNTELAALCVTQELAKLIARQGVAREIDEAIEDAGQDRERNQDESATWRLARASEALDRALRSHSEDRAEYEVAPNGVRVRRDERSALDGLLDRIGQGRGGRIDR